MVFRCVSNQGSGELVEMYGFAVAEVGLVVQSFGCCRALKDVVVRGPSVAGATSPLKAHTFWQME